MNIKALSYLQIKAFFLYFIVQNQMIFCDGFIGGTFVVTAQGMQPIEYLQPNQKVFCVSPKGILVEQPVSALQKILVHEIIEVSIDACTILMSPQQKIYVVSRNAWIAIEDLKIGDTIRTIDGGAIAITRLTKKAQRCVLYVPTIQECHNFFVSSHGILVHNAEAIFAVSALSACATAILEAISCTIAAIWIAKEAGDFLEEKRLIHELESLSAELEEEIQSAEEAEEDEQDEEELADCDNAEEEDGEEELAATVEDVLEGADQGETTRTGTKQFIKQGGYSQAKDDFDSLRPTGIKDIGIGETGVLADGRKVNVRIESSDGRATLEIQSPSGGRSLIKIRYN